jgi:hypothetical protein
MMKQKAKTIAVASTILLAGSLLSAAPAMAEGMWTSYISGAGIGFNSRTWTDQGVDQIATTVKLSGCSLNNGYAFGSTHLKLWRTHLLWFPDDLGAIQNFCTTVSWGQALGAGDYHFEVIKINSNPSTTATFNANVVVTNY